MDRSVLGSVIRFGVPVAGANMLSWALLSLDKVVIAKAAGPVALGFYVLAFNISSWPMSAIGQVVRSVALPAFSRTRNGAQDTSLAGGMAATWAIALPAGALLAALALPLVDFVYGSKWSASVPVLAALGLFGALRVAFDLSASYLLARGASQSVLWIQVLWIVALLPSLLWATDQFGIVGAGWAHVAVAASVVAPAYALAARRCGADLRALFMSVWPPLAAAVPMWVAAAATAAAVEPAGPALLVAGAVGAGLYFGLIYRWLSRALRDLTATSETRSAKQSRTRHRAERKRLELERQR
jgi:PST family polysaccharide transporter